MNKQEFYKELMKEYTFDSAKVRRRAKQSSLRVTNRRWWYIPSTVAVAAVSLTVGLFALFYNPSNIGSPIVNSGNRIDSAKLAVKVASEEYGTKTLFLSFNDSITLQEMRDSLDSVSDTGNIVVEALYILDENNQVALVRTSDGFNESGKIIGAKVCAPAALIDELNGQRTVALVEIGDDIPSDDEFIPLIVVETELPASFTVPYNESEAGVATDTSFPAYSEKYVNFNIPNVTEASFISDYRFTAITPESVMLCEISKTNFEVEVISEFSLYNHKKRPSVTGKSTLVSGVDRYGKTVLLLADADSGTLENISVSSLVESGELLNAFYDDVNRRIIMRLRSRDNNAIYIIDRDTFGQLLVPDSYNDAAILAVKGNSVYFSSGASVLKYDISEGISSELYTFPADSVVFERNADLSGFVANFNGEALVFFAETEIFTEAVAAPNGLIFYGNSADALTDGANLYKASGDGTLVIFSGQPTAVQSQFSSTAFIVDEVTKDSVKILIL